MTPDEFWEKWALGSHLPSRWPTGTQVQFLRDLASFGPPPIANPVRVARDRLHHRNRIDQLPWPQVTRVDFDFTDPFCPRIKSVYFT